MDQIPISHKLQTEQVRTIDHFALDDFINEHIDIKHGAYVAQQAHFWDKESVHTYHVQKRELDVKEKTQLYQMCETWEGQYTAEWGRECPCELSVILDHLCNKGLIDEGELAINCWW